MKWVVLLILFLISLLIIIPSGTSKVTNQEDIPEQKTTGTITKAYISNPCLEKCIDTGLEAAECGQICVESDGTAY